MSSPQPPLPPETGESNAPILRPDADDPAASLSRAHAVNDEYIEIEVPIPEDERPTTQVQGGGCIWGLGGAVGCLVLIVGILAGLLLIVGQTFSGFTDTFVNFFGGDPAPIAVPDDVYIPTVERVQSMAQLVTTKYNYSHMITTQVDMPQALAVLYGDGLAMVAVGHIQAGIDVSDISEEDIAYDEETGVLTIQLPAPTLQECFLNEQETYVVERQTGIFASGVEDLESRTRRFALRQYRDMALDDGILEDAAVQALEVFTEFIGTVAGDVELNVVIEPVDPDAELPDTCR